MKKMKKITELEGRVSINQYTFLITVNSKGALTIIIAVVLITIIVIAIIILTIKIKKKINIFIELGVFSQNY
jgi:hypothetical protein